MPRRTHVLTAVLLPTLILAAGCGSKKNTASNPAAPATPTTASTPAASGAGAVTVGETEYKLTPANATVSAGPVTITVKNNGTIAHALSIDRGAPGGGDAKSATIQPGASTTLTANLTAGKTYTWYCPIDSHRKLGMKGKITVQ
jgi:uncharacterized cupredoxin-like copper-binding protein